MDAKLSMFGQILQVIPMSEFNKAVKKHEGDRNSKGLACRDQLVSMLFCQFGRAKSLSDISNGVRGCLGKINHLGMNMAPKKNTLSYANAHRPWQIYEDTFYSLLGKCRSVYGVRKRKFRFKNKVVSIDSTTVDLCEKMFDWAKFRKTKGGIKLHMCLDHDGYLPEYSYISNAKVADVKMAKSFKFAKGTIVSMDRGYNDYTLYEDWNSAGIYFVTKLKENAVYDVIQEYYAPGGLKLFREIKLRNCNVRLNMVVYEDEKTGELVELITNKLDLGATTVEEIYRQRWQIEIFFRALKSDLKIKTFVGTSSNAVHIQIWTALIALLIIRYLQFVSSLNWSFSSLLFMLQHNLFRYKDLREWINDPYETPESEIHSLQPDLPGLSFGQHSAV